MITRFNTSYSCIFSIILSISFAHCTNSASVHPFVVIAGVPIRIPLACIGDLFSLGTQFLLTVILCLSNSSCMSFPDRSGCASEKSSQNIWLSVPPVTTLYPICLNASAMLLAFLTTWYMYSL